MVSDVTRNPQVTVVLAAYNAAGCIAAALDSLFAQTFTDFETIVVNAGSADTEDLEAVLEPYRHRIVYIKLLDEGMASARNAGLRAARGEWIAALDPGDVWFPAYLQTQVEFLGHTPGWDVIYSEAISSGDVPETGERPREATFKSLAAQDGAGFLCASMVRRQAALDAGLFDESLRTSEDFDLWLRIVKNGGRVAYHRAAAAQCQRHVDNPAVDPLRTASDLVSIYTKTLTTLALDSPERALVEQRIRLVSVRMHLLRAKQAMVQRDVPSARGHLEQSARLESSRKTRLMLALLRYAPWLALTLLVRPSDRPGGMKPQSLTSNASWILIARTLSFAFNIGLPLLIVRRLSQYEFGLYKEVFLVVQTAVSMLPLGFGMSAYYYLPRDRAHQKETIFNIMFFLTSVGILTFLTASAFPSLLVRLYKDEALASYATPIGALAGLWMVGAFLEIAPLANQEMKLATGAIVFIQVVRTMLLVAAAAVFGTVKALLWAAILQGVIQVGILLVYLVSRFGAFWRHFDSRLFRLQLSYALPIGFAGLLYTFQTDLHNYFVSNRYGALVFAIYSVGCFQLALMNMIGEAAASVMIPKVSSLEKEGAKDEIIALTLRVCRKLAVIAFGLYSYLMVVAYEFIVLLFTFDYRDSVPIFRINLTLIPLGILLFDPIARAYAEYRYTLLKMRIGLFFILFATLWWATNAFGPKGAISTVILIGVLERTGTAILFGRVLGFGRRHLAQFRDVALLAGCATLAGVITALLRLALLGSHSLVILSACGVLFVPLYGAAVILTGALRPDEVKSIQILVAGRLLSVRKGLGMMAR